MVNSNLFCFIKDDLIDPNMAFIQNVDNFLFRIYFDYLERSESKKTKERHMLLANLFRNIKSSLMGGGMDLGQKKINLMERVKEIQEQKDGEKRKSKLSKLDFDVRWYFKYPHILDELINTNFNYDYMNSSEMDVALILYCILVNGLDKTKGEKFNQIKKEMQPLIKIWKEIFCEFDKNELHKERTFIFALRAPAGYHDDFYIINNKNYLIEYSSNDDDLKFMFLNFTKDIRALFFPFFINRDEKDEKDERKIHIIVLFWIILYMMVKNITNFKF